MHALPLLSFILDGLTEYFWEYRFILFNFQNDFPSYLSNIYQNHTNVMSTSKCHFDPQGEICWSIEISHLRASDSK